MEWLSLVLGIVSLVGSLVSAGKQMYDDDQTTEYNKDLNQKVMDREDSAWQRAVADRSKAGLSVSGLSQGAGSGGTVSHLQAPQGAGNLSNILQNVSSTSFGLSDSAYNRKLQKQIATDELELKRDQLKNDKMIAGVEATLHKLQVMKELRLAEDQLNTSAAVEEREKKIFNHNYELAKRLGIVYGSDPDTTNVILGKGSEILDNVKDDVKSKATDFVDSAKSKATDFVDSTKDFLSNSVSGTWNIPIDKLKDALGSYVIDHWPSGYGVVNWFQSASGNDYTLHLRNSSGEYRDISLSKYQYDKLQEFRKVKAYRPK